MEELRLLSFLRNLTRRRCWPRDFPGRRTTRACSSPRRPVAGSRSWRRAGPRQSQADTAEPESDGGPVPRARASGKGCWHQPEGPRTALPGRGFAGYAGLRSGTQWFYVTAAAPAGTRPFAARRKLSSVKKSCQEPNKPRPRRPRDLRPMAGRIVIHHENTKQRKHEISSFRVNSNYKLQIGVGRIVPLSFHPIGGHWLAVVRQQGESPG
jgi:hypothetical protein